MAVQQLVEAIGQYNEQHGDLPLPTPINEKTADIRAAKQAMRDAEAVLDALTGTRYPWHE